MIRSGGMAGAVALVAITALLTWYWTNGLHTSAPYPTTFWWCDGPSVAGRAEFVAQCLSVVQSQELTRVEMIPWCQEMAKGIYCRPEPGFRYSEIVGGLIEQTQVMPCAGASSDAELAVCWRVR